MFENSATIIGQAKSLAQHLLECKSIGHRVPPILAEDYAQLLGIKRIVKTDLGDMAALLLPNGDGFSIKVNSSHHPVRQNFSCAHEIAHVLIEKTLFESGPNRPAFRSTTQMDPAITERLCERVAAELLMPESLFLSYLNASGVSVNSIQTLAHIFFTSAPATAKRIAELSEEPCLALYWRLVRRPRWKQTKPCLIWAAPNREFKDWEYEVPRFLSLSQRSSVFEAFQCNWMIGQFENFTLGNLRRPFYMESKGFGHKPHRYVVSLVFPQREKASRSAVRKPNDDSPQAQASLGI